MLAIKHEYNEIAQLFLERGAQVDLQNNGGKSALMLAIEHGSTEIAQLLLEKGAQVDLRDNGGKSALMLASKHGSTEIAQLSQLAAHLKPTACSVQDEGDHC